MQVKPSAILFFPDMTTFVIMTGRYPQFPLLFPSFLLNSWQNFGSRLKRLAISTCSGGFGLFLPDPDHLVSLHELTLRLITEESGVESVSTEMLNSGPRAGLFPKLLALTVNAGQSQRKSQALELSKSRNLGSTKVQVRSRFLGS